MKFATAKNRFRGDWIAFLFTNEAKEEGRVIAHHKDAHLLHKKLRSTRLRKANANVYVTFAGRLLPDPKEYAVILSASL